MLARLKAMLASPALTCLLVLFVTPFLIGWLLSSPLVFVVQTGLDQYAIKKFAEALEVVPRILSETSGQDAEKVYIYIYSYSSGACFCHSVQNPRSIIVSYHHMIHNIQLYFFQC